MAVEEILKDLTLAALADTQGIDIETYDVRQRTDVTDYMIVCSGRSSRHIKSLANNLIEKIKAAGYKPFGIEGNDSKEWVLVDLGEVIVHIMLPATRQLYDLESLWQHENSRRQPRQ